MKNPFLQFEHLIFDLDGTISDPSEGIRNSINFALRSKGYAEIKPQSVSAYIGPPLDHAFKTITGNGDSTEITALVTKFRERYSEKGYAENQLYTGIPEALEGLKKKGFSLGVCTAKRLDFAEAILRLFKIRDYFTFVDGGDVGIKKQQQLENLLAQGQVTKRSLMIGDRHIDLSAAKMNSLFSAGVLWGFGSREELTSELPDYLFESPGQLAETLA